MNHFQLIPRVKLPRSQFDLSFSALTSMNEGYLVPICVQEIYPGDTFTVNQSSVVRFTNALTTPVMDNLEVRTEWFFVPNRLVFDKWEQLMGEQDDPDDSIDYLAPTVRIHGQTGQLVPAPFAPMPVHSTILDYLGIPPSNGGEYDVEFNLFSLRSYWKVYSDWYRDENLAYSQKKWLKNNLNGEVSDAVIDAVFGNGECSVEIEGITSIGGDVVPGTSGDQIENFKKMFRLARRAKKHDYFSSCLPFPQKGEDVSISLGQTASLSGSGSIPVSSSLDVSIINGGRYGGYGYSSGSATATGLSWGGPVSEYDSGGFSLSRTVNGSVDAQDVQDALQVDLSEATAVTIASLRQAVTLQAFYELQARGGSRYIEQNRSFFGVVSPDARLQRSEYLGGFSMPFQIQTVPQTSATDDTTPQANLAAFGLSSSFNRAFSRSFTEHGTLIALASVVSRPTYQQGLHRSFSRKGRLDFYYPVFAHLSEQAVLNKEIYVSSAEDNEKVFGYQERFSELRFNNNTVSGQMRSTHPLSLDTWHLGLDFAELPKLNQDFIEENAPVDRIIDVNTQSGADQFIASFHFDIKGARVMPAYGVPQLGVHF